MFNKQKKLSEYPEFQMILNEIHAIHIVLKEHSGLFKDLSTEKNIVGIQKKLDELILWKGQVTDLAMGVTPMGKPKITRYGKRLFGKGN